jgi:CheY-like chemotaxis protein
VKEILDSMRVPVIFVTAYVDPTTRARIERSGAAGHLVKPFDEQSVLDAIRNVLAATPATPEVRRTIEAEGDGRPGE